MADMTNNAHVITTTLWLVIQEGGSSGEHYPSLYTQRDDAVDAAAGHRRDSYRSTNPIGFKAELRDGQAWVAELDLIELIERCREEEYR
jgi:hypothetical protein